MKTKIFCDCGNITETEEKNGSCFYCGKTAKAKAPKTPKAKTQKTKTHDDAGAFFEANRVGL